MNTEIFCKAIELGDFEKVHDLANSFNDFDFTNYYGMSPLDIASERGHIEIVIYLIGIGADVNYSESASPLIYAIRGSNLDIAKVLVNAGANLEFETDMGTPLIESIGSNLEILRFLIDSGARTDVFDDDGRTLIQRALDLGKKDAYEYLTQIMLKENISD